MKQDRLLLESQVVTVVDKHTNNYDRLDNDITCILEEVPEVVIAGNKEAMLKLCGSEECIPYHERFKHVQQVLYEYDAGDYSRTQLAEELVLALFLDNDLDLSYLNKWIRAITSFDVPCDAQTAIIQYLKQKYGYEER